MSAGIAILFIAAAAVMFFIYKKPRSPDESAWVSMAAMPDLTFKNSDGQDISVSSLRGRPVIFHIWASWCALCVQEISSFAALEKEFGGRLVVVEVNRRESSEIVKKYAVSYRCCDSSAVSYGCCDMSADALDAEHRLIFVADSGDALYKEIGGFSMPETIFVDASGVIRDHARGRMNATEIKRRIQDSFGL